MVKIRFNNTTYLLEILDIAVDGIVTVRCPDGTEEWIYLKDWERYIAN
jgi:hypothetical protein